MRRLYLYFLRVSFFMKGCDVLKKMCFVLVMCLVLSYSSVVFAADESLYPSRLSSLMQDGSFNESEDVVYEDGNCTSGVFYCEWSYDIYHVDLSKVTGDHLYLVDSSTSSRYSYSLYAKGKCVVYNMRYHLTNGILDFYDAYSDSFSSGSYGMLGRDVSMVKEFFTTIPIFKSGDTESINAYLNDNDCSGATNSDYIDSVKYSDEIDKPHNLKSSGYFDYITSCPTHDDSFGSSGCAFCKPIKATLLSMSWSIPDDISYVYDIDVRANYNTPNGQSSTQWISVVKGGKYSGSAIAAVYDVVHIDKGVNHLNDYVLPVLPNNTDDVTGVSLRIRHRKNKQCSNWVVITIGSSGSASAKVENSDGDTVDDGEYTNSDGYDTNNGSDGDGDTSNDGNIVAGSINVDSLLVYIRDGFGLLGNAGIITLMSKTFLFLPNSIWVMIKFFIASLITISIIGAV